MTHVFFFPSRRRHTRLQGDWSSDVCSSDLSPRPGASSRTNGRKPKRSCAPMHGQCISSIHARKKAWEYFKNKIGRASCREREKKTDDTGPRSRERLVQTLHMPIAYRKGTGR